MWERKDLREDFGKRKCFRIRRSGTTMEVLKTKELDGGGKSFGIRRSGRVAFSIGEKGRAERRAGPFEAPFVPQGKRGRQGELARAIHTGL